MVGMKGELMMATAAAAAAAGMPMCKQPDCLMTHPLTL